MGKGSRNRQVRVDDMSVNPQKYVQKKKAPKYLSTVITLILVVVIVGALIFNALSDSGTMLRMSDAVKTENFEVDGAMMSYFVHNYYQSYISNIEQTYGSLLSSNSNFTAQSLIGIDADVSLKKQVKDKETGETWFDYFLKQTRAEVEDILVYCEGAKAAGIELDEEDEAQIESSIWMLEIYAQAYGYSTSSYMANMYGVGVREKDVRNAIELSTLANKFVQKLNDDLYDAATEEKVNAYFAEHETDYMSADYLVFSLSADMKKLADDATDEEKAAAEAAYAEDKAAVDATAASLKAAASADEFRAAVKEYLMETSLESYMDQHYEDYLEKAEGETDEEKAAFAENKVKEELEADVDSQIEDMLKEDAIYSNENDVDKWLFGEEGKNPAAVNTAYLDVKESEDKTSYDVDIYYVASASAKNEEATYDVAYLVLTSTYYTEEDANKALESFKTAGADKDALLGLAEEFASNSGCTEIENMRSGYFGMEEVDAWVFGGERKAGDFELLTSKVDSTTYYVLPYVIGEGDAAWYADCTDDMVADEVEQWLEDAKKTYPVYADEKAMAKISM